jgi:hypothetical protein
MEIDRGLLRKTLLHLMPPSDLSSREGPPPGISHKLSAGVSAAVADKRRVMGLMLLVRLGKIIS